MNPPLLPGVPTEMLAYQERRLQQLKDLRDTAIHEDGFGPADVERINTFYQPYIDMLAQHLDRLKSLGPGIIIERP